MATLVLGFGSNLGDRQSLILQAYKLVEERVGRLVKQSSLFETKPWGFESENLFMNSVAVFETQFSSQECLQQINNIEAELGRKRSGNAGYESRTMDIDILFYDSEIIDEENLVVPHPLLHKRAFVLEPLKEIMPDFEHPVLKKQIKDIAI
mgnify:FL=1